MVDPTVDDLRGVDPGVGGLHAVDPSIDGLGMAVPGAVSSSADGLGVEALGLGLVVIQSPALGLANPGALALSQLLALRSGSSSSLAQPPHRGANLLCAGTPR